MSNALTRPLVCYNHYAHWVFALPKDRFEVLYQANPALYRPDEVVDFVVQAADPASTGVPRMGHRVWITPARGSAKPPEDHLARRMWQVWPDLYTSAEAFALPKPARPQRLQRGGFVWEVWSGPPVEGAFRMFNHDGTVEPLYDLARRPFAELAEALTAGETLAAILKGL